MALFTWNDSYSVSNEAIDNQHKKLIDLINTLHEAMIKGEGRSVLSDVLKELLAYTKTHFKSEEALMEKAGYSELGAHKAIHDQFTAQVDDFCKKYESGNLAVTMELMGTLKNWLIDHIQGTDKRYVSRFEEAGINSKACEKQEIS